MHRCDNAVGCFQLVESQGITSRPFRFAISNVFHLPFSLVRCNPCWMRSLKTAILLQLACLAICFTTHAGETSKPNILFIVGDDMGYSDVGFNGCKDIP